MKMLDVPVSIHLSYIFHYHAVPLSNHKVCFHSELISCA